MDSAFLQIGVVTIVAALLGIAARLLRQPIILAYMVAGMVLGSSGLGLIDNPDLTQDIATIGIVFLLFLVGLELDIGKLKRLGRVVLATGLIQLLVVAGLGYGLVLALGHPPATALYLGLAAAFSSTAVVLKRLADRHELSSLYGRVTVGILLLQDVLAIVILMMISGTAAAGFSLAGFEALIARGVVFLAATWLVTRYLLGPLFYFIAKSTELLFLTSIAWAFLFAVLADSFGFSKEIGAFVAGLSLATLPYNLEIIGRVRPLKDFFLVMFFVVLGLEVSLGVISAHWPLILLLTGLVIFVKTLAGAAVMTRIGYPKRPAYLTGAALGQMSEFSLLIVLAGSQAGHLPPEIVTLTATLLAVSITVNSYWFNLNRYIYPVLAKPLGWLNGRVRSHELNFRPDQPSDHILLFGANRMGAQMLRTLEAQKKDVLVVDHNPELIRRLLRRGVTSVYGDIDDYELLRDMGLASAKMVISTVPNLSANLYLIEQTRRRNPEAVVIVTGDQIREALDLYQAGADYVILPHLLGGEQAAALLTKIDSSRRQAKALRSQRTAHIGYLRRHRADLGV